MALLLDTHTFLWFVANDILLPISIKNKIKNINEPCFMSVASLWEIVIKMRIGKLILNLTLSELFEYVERNRIEILQIEFEHLSELSKLPMHHSDPFDRLIISQAISEKMILITKDSKMKKYNVSVEW